MMTSLQIQLLLIFAVAIGAFFLFGLDQWLTLERLKAESVRLAVYRDARVEARASARVFAEVAGEIPCLAAGLGILQPLQVTGFSGFPTSTLGTRKQAP